MLGTCLGFGGASFAPLWEVQRPRGQAFDSDLERTARCLAGLCRGSFWDLLGEPPSALERSGDAGVLDRVRARRWRNVRTTLLVLAAGAGLGCAIWALRFVPPLIPPGE
jgi:hypothetical protein